MVDPAARRGRDRHRRGEVTRRAVVAPLNRTRLDPSQAGVARSAALDWLDGVYGRSFRGHGPWPTGPAIVRPADRPRPARHPPPRGRLTVRDVRPRRAGPLAARRRGTPAGGRRTPPLAVVFEPAFLPVLVADYLALHLAIYGAIQLGLLALWRIPLGPFSTDGFVFLVAGCGLVVIALDRYAANFVPTSRAALDHRCPL